MDDRICALDFDEWRPGCDAGRSDALCEALENGKLMYLPRLRFALEPGEERFLSAAWSGEGRKNISLRPHSRVARGASAGSDDLAALGAMMARYADSAEALLDALFPRYRAGRARGNTSFRPASIEGRQVSWRSDDTRMHVDSFPSNPVRGLRILRVFSNVHPGEATRDWLVGEPFEAFARRFLPGVRPPVPGSAAVLRALGITKGIRSPYDHFMLGLHDAAKSDMAFQRESPRLSMRFPPGSTWIAFTDQVVHAALAGQHAFEQTFYVDPGCLRDRNASPLAILERLTGRALA